MCTSVLRGCVFGAAVCVAWLVGWNAHSFGETYAEKKTSRSIVYPAPQNRLKMNHSHPAHKTLACETCHANAEKSTRASELLIPAEATCKPCHEKLMQRDKPSQCSFCHVGWNAAEPLLIPQSKWPPPRLHFSHQAHLRQGVSCTSCHQGMAEPKTESQAHLPTMQSCFVCHKPGQEKASHRCSLCHLAEPNGKLRTHFKEGWLNPPAWLLGLSHDRDWLVRHRWVAADHAELCSSCHTEKDCTDCHDGRVRPTRIHPGDWIHLHVQAARRQTTQCTSCHTVQQFCAECHARLGISSMAAPKTRMEGRFHPPAEVWLQGANKHALEAQRSLSSCASCHAEQDCVQCHGSSRMGATGISPHPPGFASGPCRKQLRANSRACTTCHGNLSSLEPLCN